MIRFSSHSRSTGSVVPKRSVRALFRMDHERGSSAARGDIERTESAAKGGCARRHHGYGTSIR